MKKLSLFELRGMNRKVIDDFMIDNNYKIENVDFLDNKPDNILVTYKLQSVVIQKITIGFNNGFLDRILFH